MRDSEKDKARLRERYQAFKDMGLCTRCGQDYAMDGRTVCPECSFKEAEKARERYKNQTDEQRIRNLERIKAKKQRNRDAGLCECGKQRIDKRYKMCLECRLYQRRRKQENAQPKGYEKLACAVGVAKRPQKEQNTAQSILNKCGSCVNVISDQTGLTLQTASILED